MEKKTKKELVRQLLSSDTLDKNEEELIDLLIDQPISIDVDKEDEKTKSFGDRVSDIVSEFAGSWAFIIGFSFFLVCWVIINTIVITDGRLDPYPFILLNLVLSCISALQAPFILMSQNRQAEKDSLRNKHDYHVDLKSELILEVLHNKIEEIEKNQKIILEYIKNKEK